MDLIYWQELLARSLVFKSKPSKRNLRLGVRIQVGEISLLLLLLEHRQGNFATTHRNSTYKDKLLRLTNDRCQIQQYKQPLKKRLLEYPGIISTKEIRVRQLIYSSMDKKLVFSAGFIHKLMIFWIHYT